MRPPVPFLSSLGSLKPCESPPPPLPMSNPGPLSVSPFPSYRPFFPVSRPFHPFVQGFYRWSSRLVAWSVGLWIGAAWRCSSLFLPSLSGCHPGGDRRPSSSSSSVVLADCVWAKVRAKPHYDFVVFWGGDPLPIFSLFALLGRTGACPFFGSIVDRLSSIWLD